MGLDMNRTIKILFLLRTPLKANALQFVHRRFAGTPERFRGATAAESPYPG